MGSMSSLRDALRRCREKVDSVAIKGRQLWSDQALIGEVIGEQEIWSEWIRHLGSSWSSSASRNGKEYLGHKVRNIADAALLGLRFEFGIGLDYSFTTAPQLVLLRKTVTSSTSPSSPTYEKGLKRLVCLRIHGVPPELRDIKGKLLSKTDWGSVPLYTNFFFGVTPVGIHRNACVDGLKGWRLKNWWDKMWYYPQLRHPVTQRLKPSADEITLSEIDHKGPRIT
ncbi:hypothetical protein F66182_4498 [Fusarium sp. NRRL 66182]|nr:hypothetical protein F66182_4498 [Fusarium sp. NRRL 66182]